MRTACIASATVFALLFAPLVQATDGDGAARKAQIMAQYEARQTQLKDEHETAKSKCNALTGGERKACNYNAKTAYEQGDAKAAALRDAALAETNEKK
jgi:hypothetical protein